MICPITAVSVVAAKKKVMKHIIAMENNDTFDSLNYTEFYSFMNKKLYIYTMDFK